MVNFLLGKKGIRMVNTPRTYVFDLDGVLYRGDAPLPHASETVRELKRRGRRVYFFTNNSGKSRKDFQAKLERIGIPASTDEIMTSGYATSLYFKENNHLGKRVYVVGESGLKQELELAGMEIFKNGNSGKIDFVVAGIDREFTYEKLTKAQQAIINGAMFIATNRDVTFPVENSVVIPGGGAIVSAIETASEVKPFVIGKPWDYALEKILESAGSTSEESIMVGDRLETDILLGNRAGMVTVLVTTGVSTRYDAEHAGEEMKPCRIIDDLIELLDESRSVR